MLGAHRGVSVGDSEKHLFEVNRVLIHDETLRRISRTRKTQKPHDCAAN